MKLTLNVSWYSNIAFSFSEAVLESLLTSAESMFLGVVYYDTSKVTSICDDAFVSVTFDTSVIDKNPVSRYVLSVDLKGVDVDIHVKVRSVLASIGINFTETCLSVINTKYLNPEGVFAKGEYSIEED